MRVLFLDIDGVLNSYASATFWHFKRDQEKWENEVFNEWKGSLKEFLARDWDPIALSNLEELMRNVPDLKICVSSTWRLGETVETLKEIFCTAPLVRDAIFSKTPRQHGDHRGSEIDTWLKAHPEVTQFIILDDDADMDPHMDKLVQTDARNGFTYTDMLKICERFGVNGKDAVLI